MTDREKMLAGELYYPQDAELAAIRLAAHRLIDRFNQTGDGETELRAELLQKILGRAGANLEMTPPVRFDYGCNTYIGDRCYFNFNATFLDCAEIRIEDDVLVGPNVSFLTPLHPLLAAERNFFFDAKGTKRNLEYARPILIKRGVWLGGGVIVNPGVTIGAGSVIGSGSVVTRNIPEGVLAFGNPCRVVRKLTGADSVRPKFKQTESSPLTVDKENSQ
ncbi:MAG: sugar O-acetyltransferase [Thermoguttaceae bacterium]|nr:sugar O-acetyltransferase [Thermoguttaceae bacterium]